jgi:hypothetical protein
MSDGGFNLRRPCCGVASLAFATEAPFHDVWDWFAKRNGRDGRWGGRTYVHDYPSCAIAFGKQLKRKHYDRMTLKKWVEWYCSPAKKYVIRVTGHVMYIEDGLVTDQSNCCPVDDHWSRRKMVTHVWEVE